MRISQREFEHIRSVLAKSDAEGPLTAREILNVLDDHGLEFESAHRVATVLGQHAQSGDVEIIRDQPYRYQLTSQNN